MLLEKRKTKSRKVHVRQAGQCCSSSHEETNRTEEPSTSSSGESTVCPYCFLSPCVATTNENSPWLGEGQGPSNYNPSVRKGLYRRFWKCISNLGGWDVEQYLRKKERLGEGRPNIVYHQRQVMPERVLKLVRSKYPNPHSDSYIGHKWE